MVQKVSGDMLKDGAVAEAATGFTAGNYTRVAVDGTLEERTPTEVRSDIGAGTGSGTVTSVNLVSTTGLTASGGPIVGSGSLTYTLSANLQSWSGIAPAAKQNQDNGLDALAAFNTSAFVVQTSTNVFAGRTLTGTAGRITITNPAGTAGNPVFDIDPTYAGQATITTLGTITTGVWTGTDIAVADGGTGASTAAAARTNLGFADGTYTPTGTVGANCTITAVRAAQYLRVGNTVHVSGIADITVTAASTFTHFELSLPVASNFANIWELAGAGSNTESAAYTPIRVIANTTNDRAVLTFYPTSTGLRSIGYTYSYQVI